MKHAIEMRTIVILISLLYASLLPADTPSVVDYQKRSDENKFDSYIYGLSSGMDWLNEQIYTSHSIEVYCKPRDLDLSAKDLKRLIDSELIDNKSFYDKYNYAPLLGLALRNAYLSNFPCAAN